MAFDFGSAVESANAVDQMFKLNKGMKVLTGAIFGLSKSADKSFLNIGGRKAAAEKITKSKVDLKLESDNLQMESDIVDKIDTILNTLDKAGFADNSNSLSGRILLFTDEQLKNAHDTLAFLNLMSEWSTTKSKALSIALNSVTSIMVYTAEKLVKNEKSIEFMNQVITTYADGMNQLSTLGTSLIKLAVGFTLFGLAMVGFVKIAGAGGIAIAVGSLLVIGAAFKFLDWINSRGGQASEGDSMFKDIGMDFLFMAGSIATLALAALIFQQTGFKGLLMVGLAIGMMVGAMKLADMGKGKKKKTSEGADFTILVIAISVAVLAGAIWLWNKLVPDAGSALAPALAFVTIAGVLALISGKAADMIKGALAIGIASLSLIIMSYALKSFAGISYEDLAKPALALAGITVSLLVLGNMGAASLMGAAALIIGALALSVLSNALVQAESVSGETMLGVGLFIVGFGAALILLGTFPMSILGAAALVVGGFALTLIAKGIKDLNGMESTMLGVAGGLIALSGAFAVIGNPFTLVFLLSGVAAAIGIGVAINQLGKGIMKFNNFSRKDFDKAGQGIKSIMNAIKEPLADIGNQTSGSWLFSTNPVSQGIEAVQGLGGVMSSLAQGVRDMANLTFTEYEVRNGKLVPVKRRQLTTKDFKAVGENFDLIINSVKAPLVAIGKSGGFFTDSDFKNGIDEISELGSIFDPLTNLVDTFSKYSQKDMLSVGENVGVLLKSLNKTFGNTPEFDYDFDVLSDFADVVEELADSSDALTDFADSFETIADSIERINKSLDGNKFKKIMDVSRQIESLASGKMNDKFAELLELVGEKMTDVLEKIEEAINTSGSTNISNSSKVSNISSSVGGDGQKVDISDNMKVVESILTEISDQLRGTIQVSTSKGY